MIFLCLLPIKIGGKAFFVTLVEIGLEILKNIFGLVANFRIKISIFHKQNGTKKQVPIKVKGQSDLGK